MKWIIRILPLVAGAAVVAVLLAWLELDWRQLFGGDFGAASEALRRASQESGPAKVAVILALAALLPFSLVPITVVFFSAALVLPAKAAMPVILCGALLNTSLAYAAGLSYGARLAEFLGLDRFAAYRALKAGAGSHGFKMALLSRFIPSPFVLQAMVGAAIGIRLWQMLCGTFLAMLPWTLLYVAFPEAVRRGDLRLLGPVLGVLAVMTGLGWWVRAKLTSASPAQAKGPAQEPGPLAPQAPALGPELTLYTLPGDPACADARRELVRLRPLLGFEVRELDIAAQPREVEALYREHVPVLLLGDEKLFSFQVDENLLKLRMKAWHSGGA